MSRVYPTVPVAVVAALLGALAFPSLGARAEARARWAAVVLVDLTSPSKEVYRTARIESELVLPRAAMADASTLTFALPDEACGLDVIGVRTCKPVTVQSVTSALSGKRLEFRTGQGLLVVTMPASEAAEEDVDVIIRYTFPAFARGSGLYGLSGTDHWIPLERNPIGAVLLEIRCPAAERALAGGRPMGDVRSGKTRLVTYGQVDGHRPGVLVGPLGPTATAVEGLIDTTLANGVVFDSTLRELLITAATQLRDDVGETRSAPIHAVIAPFPLGSPGAPLVGTPGAFADRLLLLHSPRLDGSRDVIRVDRLFEMPSRQIPDTEDVVRAGLYSHWASAVRISDSPRDAWLAGFFAGAMEDRSIYGDPWSSPAGYLRRDHGALWPGDPVPQEASLEEVGFYLAKLIRLRLGGEEFKSLFDRTLAASKEAPLTTVKLFEIWDIEEALFSVSKAFKDALNARCYSYFVVSMKSTKIGDEDEGAGYDAAVTLTRHGGHPGLNAVHVAVLTTSGEVRDTWAIVGDKGGSVDVIGLSTAPIEAFIIRDSVAVAVTSADLVPRSEFGTDFDLD